MGGNRLEIRDRWTAHQAASPRRFGKKATKVAASGRYPGSRVGLEVPSRLLNRLPVAEATVACLMS